MENPRRVGLLLTATLLVVSVASGCGVLYGSEPPEPDPTAKALATALELGDLDEVPLFGQTTADSATEHLNAMLAPLDQIGRTVRFVRFARPPTDDEATAVLRWTWNVTGAESASWQYTTEAELRVANDAWAVDWDSVGLIDGLRRSETVSVTRVAAPRGDITGRDGAVLVTKRPVLRIGIDKTKVDASVAATSAERLAELVGLDEPASFRERTESAGSRAFVEAITIRDDGSFALDRDDVTAIPGAILLTDSLPLAPTRTFARPILGTVGAATAEIIEDSGGAIHAGDEVGLSGLQRQYDDQLRGTPGIVVSAVPEDSSARDLYRLEPVAGAPLRTTLDPALQQAAEDIVAGVGPASAIVAVQPSTGAVLVAASGPGGGGQSTATTGQYAPGSTFKVVTALALVNAGLEPASTVDCPDTISVDGKVFKNYDDYPATRLGSITLRQAIANSCNTAMIGQREHFTVEQLAESAAALGIGGGSDGAFQYFAGSVPTDVTKTEAAAATIGQGKVLVSPLAMATVAASISAGRTVTPYLVGDVLGSGGSPPDAKRLDAERVAAVRDMMRSTVTEGSAGVLAAVPGAEVVAKTGTAEYGAETPPRTHAWMIAAQGDLAFAAFVEDGAGGATTAGPLLARLLSS